MASVDDISGVLDTISVDDIRAEDPSEICPDTQEDDSSDMEELVPSDDDATEIHEADAEDEASAMGEDIPVDDAPRDMRDVIVDIYTKIDEAIERREKNKRFVELVAVSKTHPVEKIVKVYRCKVKNFGENYVDELVEKANHPLIVKRCRHIRWHFIGHLQTNKVSKLLSVKRLWMVQTVDSRKLADTLNQKWGAIHKTDPLNVMIQVNTSGEEGKHGIPPDEVVYFIVYITEMCPHLNLMGLMTIGSAGHDLSLGPNPDFEALVNCRNLYYETDGIDQEDLLEELIQLSMGMSHDYEHAVEMGSDMVRIGRTIFGDRPKKEEDRPKVEDSHEERDHAKEEDRPKVEDSHEERDHAKEEDHPKEEEGHPKEEEDHPKEE